ncbi:hypothetical protein SAMN02745121_03145 [Nannocystis exedens]|uniref:Uncharacterized protein n=1 Tax=Nannocystis exedens TaxID=54 RepID=A0A1I1Y8M1_9BACT|nr:hypothetical protein [Nannocystis exedens]PCC71793.1 hypothetical protein NAEX_04872 [Nannocystis exedens]SFE14210.1 hypothetical protein SAMN02745121_03145 [Nannocystis exedens]
MLRFCDPYALDVPDALADRTGYVFEEAGAGEADRLAIEVEELPADVRPADVIAANRKSAARALGGDPGWPEGQVMTGLGPAHTLAITDPEIAGGVWVAALRDDRGRMWTLRFESAREWADTVFLALVAAIGGGSLPPGWAERRAHGVALALPAWLRPPRVFRFASAGDEVTCLLDQGSSDMPQEAEFEAWGEPAPGELLVVHPLAAGTATLAGAEAAWGEWRLDRCDPYGAVLGSTWARVAAAPGLSLRLVVIERAAEALGGAGFSAMVASVARH